MKNYLILFFIFSLTALLSFINQMVYANYFGASKLFDMLNAILSLPFAIIGIGAGAVSLVIMPILNESKNKYGSCSKTLIILIKNNFVYLLILSFIIILIQYYTFYDKIEDIYYDKFIKLTILSGIFLFFSFLNSFFISYYNLEKRFILASINAMITYFISIILCILFATNIGVDIVIYSLVISNIILLIIFYINFTSVYSKEKLIEYQNNVNINKLALLAGVFSILPFTFPVFIDSYFLLSLGQGSLSYVSYANKIVVMMTSILIQPLNLILFPKILENINNGEIIKKILYKIYLIVFIGVIFLFIFTKLFFLDFMAIFFEKGMFTEKDSIRVYSVFLIYIYGVFGMVSMNIQNKVMTSLKLYKIQIIASLIFILSYFILMYYFIDKFKYLSSGYVYSICWMIYCIIILLLINKINNYMDKR